MKNGYATRNGYYRDVKLNIAIQCGALGSILAEVQLLLEEVVEAKKKMHAVYQVVRGDFWTTEATSVESKPATVTKRRVSMVSWETS